MTIDKDDVIISDSLRIAIAESAYKTIKDTFNYSFSESLWLHFDEGPEVALTFEIDEGVDIKETITLSDLVDNFISCCENKSEHERIAIEMERLAKVLKEA